MITFHDIRYICFLRNQRLAKCYCEQRIVNGLDFTWGLQVQKDGRGEGIIEMQNAIPKTNMSLRLIRVAVLVH